MWSRWCVLSSLLVALTGCADMVKVVHLAADPGNSPAVGTSKWFEQYKQERVQIVGVMPYLMSPEAAYYDGVISREQYDLLKANRGEPCRVVTKRVGSELVQTFDCSADNANFMSVVEVSYRTTAGEILKATYPASSAFKVGTVVVISRYKDLVLK